MPWYRSKAGGGDAKAQAPRSDDLDSEAGDETRVPLLPPGKKLARKQSSPGKGGKPGKMRYGPCHGGAEAASCSLLVLGPWLVFNAIICLHIYAFYRFSAPVWTLVFVFVALSGMFVALGVKAERGGVRLLQLGVFCGLASFAGAMAGLHGYHEYALQYWWNEENRVYSNVLPSEPAVAHFDAGLLGFSLDTRVQVEKTVGYQFGGTLYCVAPVISDAWANLPPPKVQYWAAGKDCCRSRTSFTCGNAWDRSARSGYALVDAGLMDSLLFPSSRPLYLKAAWEAAGVYGLDISEEPLLVHWVSDFADGQNELWHKMLMFVLGSMFVSLLVSFAFAGAAVCIWKS